MPCKLYQHVPAGVGGEGVESDKESVSPSELLERASESIGCASERRRQNRDTRSAHQRRAQREGRQRSAAAAKKRHRKLGHRLLGHGGETRRTTPASRCSSSSSPLREWG
eukprot:scaffold12213_cov30-Tisochrysis_lutea.AAC.4